MLNSAQSIAISHREGPMLVLAGPGSGKTLVITQRIKFLIEQCNVEPEKILVITFTKAAADQMQFRFARDTKGKDYKVNFGTFHAIFFHILKQTYRFDASSILKESEKYKYLEQIIRTFSPETSIDKIPMLISEISKIKNSGIDVEKYESEVCDKEEFIKIYDKYKWTMMQYKKVDFDDMVYLCLRLLKERPKVLEYWQQRFKYILIDEFQDINPLQYEVVKLLAKPEDNLFIVGDDDQAIYGFRGSNPQIMLGFPEEYRHCKKVLLNVNYRSSKDIVDASIRLINNNHTRFNKDISTFNQSTGGVKIVSFYSRQEQAQNIVSLIKQYMNCDGANYSDIAIISRTNAGSSAYTEALIKERIPFQMKEKINKFYDNNVVKDIIAYLCLALNDKDVKSFIRIMNRPVRYITRDSVCLGDFSKESIIINNKGKDYVIHNIIDMFDKLEFIKNMSPFAAVNFIRRGIRYDEYLTNAGSEDFDILDELQERAKAFDTIEEWLAYIKEYDSRLEEAQKRNDDCVKIVTMHASKGLEWPVVIIPDVNEGIVPHKKANTEEELEEERRMFYVAMTRAKTNLFLFYLEEEDKKKTGKNLPSRYLREISDNHSSPWRCS